MSCLLDPRAFNVLIIILFLAAAVRWAYAGNWPQSGYWASAAVLNIFVTTMSK